MMTPLLQHTMDELVKLTSQLSVSEQDTLARWLLDEITAETRWQSAFAASAPVLSTLAEEALAEYRTEYDRLIDRV